MMSNRNSIQKVALVTEALWKMGGSNRVLESFAQMYPQADIYALFGNQENLSEMFEGRNVRFSFLNKFPFIKKMYRYTFHLWPIAIEQLDSSEYDLVISLSSSVAHGVITPLGCKHLVYVNTPMRYAWDLSSLYRDIVNFGLFRRVFKEFFLTVNRTWDVVAAQRAEILVCNSKFVEKRIKKYWNRDVDVVVHPPVSKYEGQTVSKRKDYYIAGAPFEPNKRGDFLLECASKLGFNLKLIGGGSMKKKLKKKYKKFDNIQFLNWVSEEEKWELLSNAKGFVVPGMEDYGIFCAEAISCGTPVLAYRGGGSLEIIEENSSGIFFDDWSVKDFKKAITKFEEKDWDYNKVKESLNNANSKKEFKEKIERLLVE
jgi:glycosyltransferase involved in cell wall biosynthesis